MTTEESASMPEYPGLGLPLRYRSSEEFTFPIGIHGNCAGIKSDMLPVREIAMMNVIDRLTDKTDWHKKAFNEEIVAKWRAEALGIPDEYFWKLSTYGKYQYWDDEGEVMFRDEGPYRKCLLQGIMNENTFDCCIQELRSKAKYFEKAGIIPTLDSSASIAKSDNLVSQGLRDALKKSFEKLKSDQAAAPDWHPNSNDMVQNLVHPSMYPLVYDRSRVLNEELVGVNDAIDKWAGKGDVIPKDIQILSPRHSYDEDSLMPLELWSNTYQWLPANVALQDDGTVKFTSYINNLHPAKYPEIYRTIEELIETALPAWDQCLALASHEERKGAGRVEHRCFKRSNNHDDGNYENWVPSDPKEVTHVEVNWDEVKNEKGFYDQEHDEESLRKWHFLRRPRIPEAIFKDVDYAPEIGKRLVDRFKKSGLQVIVKMASIELTPEKPQFPVGGWHIEGQMNEHICATALYYLDSENITTSNLSFRMQTSIDVRDGYGDVRQDSYGWLEQIHGTALGSGAPCLQNYGSVETREGRLLAFPNVFQHRVSSFSLVDPTKPGHRRFIALWLVNPLQRIISTANVPPQQQDWWLGSVFGDTVESQNAAISKLPAEIITLMQEKAIYPHLYPAKKGKLPTELMEMVWGYYNASPETLLMGLEEAKEHRRMLMEERSDISVASLGNWESYDYNFCEH